jgi:hypothetical protein
MHLPILDLRSGSVVGSLLLAAWNGSALATQHLNCGAYAGLAVAQQEQNVQMKCGFTGGRWSNDFKGHFQWCQTSTMAKLTAEDKARKAALAKCTKKPQEDQQACQAYAAEAVKQQKANKAKGCGLKGGAWSEDYASHFGWCLKASPGKRVAENNARNQQLAGCFSAKKGAEDQAMKDSCAQYAATAVSQQTENLNRKCNFTGGAWNKDWNVHFKWCMGGQLKKTGQQTQARLAALKTKCMKRVCTKTETVLAYPPFYEVTTKCRNVPK